MDRHSIQWQCVMTTMRGYGMVCEGDETEKPGIQVTNYKLQVTNYK